MLSGVYKLKRKIKNTFGALYANDNLTKKERGPEWEKLEIALKDKNITNIGILAPYDTGKSSFLLSFFKNWNFNTSERIIRKLKFQRECYRFVSVPNFFEDIKDKKKSVIELEKDILDQLLLESRASRIRFPDSQIRRIHSINLLIVIVSYLLILLLIGIVSNGKFIINPNKFLNSIGLLILAVFGFVIYYMFLHSLNKLSLQLSTKFKVNSATINADLVPSSEIKDGDKFVEYNDELRYFFDKSGERFIIFEDLDRYNNPLIFQRLRALNKRLNSFRKSPIVFIYTLKDSAFSKDMKNTDASNENYAAEARGKFFDYTISIFPLHNLENSIDEFYEQRKQCGHALLINEKYFYGVGKYIHDKREIISIMSDVDIYAQKLNLAAIKNKESQEEAFNKLFGLMIYKNVYSADFDKLIIGKSFLSQLILDKKEIFDDVKSCLSVQDELIESDAWSCIFQYVDRNNFEDFAFSEKIKADLERLFNHPILFYLITNDLLCEDYHNYLSPTFFSLNSPKDRSFINKVLSHQVIKRTEQLENPLKVLTYLNQVNADYTYAYSVDLLIELFRQADVWNQIRHAKVILSEVRRRKDYKFIYQFLLQDSNLSKREKIAYIYNSWDTFFDDVLRTNLKIRKMVIDYILEGMVEKEDRFGRMIRYLKKSDFLNKKDVQKALIGKLTFSKLYTQKYYLLVKESHQVYLFSDLNIFLFKRKLQ